MSNRKNFIVSLTALVGVVFFVVVIVLYQQRNPQQKILNTVVNTAKSDTLYIHRIDASTTSKYIISTSEEFLNDQGSHDITATMIGTISNITQDQLWGYDVRLYDNRWLSLVPYTAVSTPVARIIDLQGVAAEQSIQLSFIQPSDFTVSDTGDFLAGGYYDPVSNDIVYLLRLNVMLATEGSGAPLATSTAEIWTQSVTGGTPKLQKTFNAKTHIFSEEVQYDIPDRITQSGGERYVIWRSSLDRLDSANTAKTLFESTDTKKNSSVVMHVAFGTQRQILIEELRYTGTAAATKIFIVDPSAQIRTITSLSESMSPAVWSPEESDVLAQVGSGEWKIINLSTGDTLSYAYESLRTLSPLSMLNEREVLVGDISDVEAIFGWWQGLYIVNVQSGVTSPLSINGSYYLLSESSLSSEAGTVGAVKQSFSLSSTLTLDSLQLPHLDEVAARKIVTDIHNAKAFTPVNDPNYSLNGDCGVSENVNILKRLNEQKTMLAVNNGSYVILRTPNLEHWNAEAANAFISDPTIVCGAGFFIPFEVSPDYILWRRSCSSGMLPTDANGVPDPDLVHCIQAEEVISQYYHLQD